MDAIKNIIGRRSIRKYTEKKIPRDIVDSLLDAGMHAPSARNLQPWHFIVVDDREMILALSEAHPYATMLRDAALAILVCGDRNIQEMDGYIVQDCSAATQNIMLAAHAMGIGSVWLGMYPRRERMQEISKLLGIPDHILPVSLISLGYPAEEKEPPQRYSAERVHRNKF